MRGTWSDLLCLQYPACGSHHGETLTHRPPPLLFTSPSLQLPPTRVNCLTTPTCPTTSTMTKSDDSGSELRIRRRRRRSHSRSPPLVHRKRPMSEDDSGFATTDACTTDDERVRKPVVAHPTLLVDEGKGKKWASWWRRFWWTLAMIGGFTTVLLLLRQTGLVLMVVIVQANIYRELVNLAIRENKERQLPGFSAFYWYWFAVGMFYMYGNTLMEHFRYHDTTGAFSWILDHHTAYAWALYIAGLMAFVTSLKKRKLYRYQFKQFAFCHTALVAVVFQSTLLASNVFQGLIWFVLPCGLVVCNDCMAYVFGFFFGRTPLIRLSPKKTWEGFLGGFFATVVFAFWFARLLQGLDFFTCPKLGFGLSLTECSADSATLASFYRLHAVSSYLSPAVAQLLPSWLLASQLSALQIHSVIMAVFASLCAPFGGFFASGFKRAFKIKDFGTSIPGHGGFTDRMDCQIIMGLFVYVYFHNVIAFGGYDIESSLSKVLSLPHSQQMLLLERLASHLGRALA